MFPVGVLWGYRPRKELKEGGAKKVVDEPLDVLNLLQGL
jgi:phosphoglycolate phosphatase-like HAD superfamily hydrolase